jgi:hypothetical protein
VEGYWLKGGIVAMIEKDMEDLIASFPDDFFPRRRFALIGRQQSFSGIGRFDLLFEDEFKSTILMELKARPFFWGSNTGKHAVT